MMVTQATTLLDEACARFVEMIHTTASESTAETYRWALDSFARFINETSYAGHEVHDEDDPDLFSIDHLEEDVLAEFYLWLRKVYDSPHTVRTYMAALRRFLVWLDARGMLPPAFQLGKAQSRLKADQGEEGLARYKHQRIDPEIPRIVTYYDQLELPEGSDWPAERGRLKILRARAIVHTLYASGGRVGEVTSLTRDDVLDGRVDEVHLPGKGGKTRVILLARQAMHAIQAYTTERSDDYPGLFISHGRGYGKPLGRGTIWRVVKQAVEALDLHQSTSPHSFRHYRATQLLNQGMPLESVQAYLGHADISTTRTVYAHTKTAVLKEQLGEFGLSPEEALEKLEHERDQREQI